MPVFAMANAGVVFQLSDFADPVAIAVMFALFLGKPLGVALFSFLAVRLKLCQLPTGVTWPLLISGGFLTGIGFTMSLFIASLALDGAIRDAAKVGVLAGSLLGMIAGMTLLILLLPPKNCGNTVSHEG